MLLDPRRWWVRSRREAVEPRVAAEVGEAGERRALDRQALGLLVGDHLQPVLEPAQEEVGVRQLVDRFGADPAVGVQFARACRACARRASAAAAAEDQLLRLHEELDLADAAAPELDVVAGHGDRSWPRTAWICRFIAWMSAIAA